MNVNVRIERSERTCDAETRDQSEKEFRPTAPCGEATEGQPGGKSLYRQFLERSQG